MSQPINQSQRAAFSSPRRAPVWTPRRDPRTAPFVLALMAASHAKPGDSAAMSGPSPGLVFSDFATRLIGRRQGIA